MEEVLLEYQSALLGPSSLLGFIPWYATKQESEETKVCFPEVQGSDFRAGDSRVACCVYSLFKVLELLHFLITAAQAALDLRMFPTFPQLFRTAPLLIVSSITWRRKLPLMHSINFLEW